MALECQNVSREALGSRASVGTCCASPTTAHRGPWAQTRIWPVGPWVWPAGRLGLQLTCPMAWRGGIKMGRTRQGRLEEDAGPGQGGGLWTWRDILAWSVLGAVAGSRPGGLQGPCCGRAPGRALRGAGRPSAPRPAPRAGSAELRPCWAVPPAMPTEASGSGATQQVSPAAAFWTASGALQSQTLACRPAQLHCWTVALGPPQTPVLACSAGTQLPTTLPRHVHSQSDGRRRRLRPPDPTVGWWWHRLGRRSGAG